MQRRTESTGRTFCYAILLLAIWATFFAPSAVIQAQPAPNATPAEEEANQAGQALDEEGTQALLLEEGQEGMTLAELLKAGGWVMWVLGFLSVLALTLAFYYLFAFTERKLIPPDLVTQIMQLARDQRVDDIARLCRRANGMFAKVVLAGATRSTTDPATVSAAMEAVGRREGESLLRRVRYLSDIATVAPMLGLLGTVLGMIQAFNFIAFDISAVKPVALASAVAQALVTTAAGLIVAIPSMGLFYFFRGKLESLIGRMEEVSVEVADQIGHSEGARASKTARKGVQMKHPRSKTPRPPAE